MGVASECLTDRIDSRGEDNSMNFKLLFPGPGMVLVVSGTSHRESNGRSGLCMQLLSVDL